MSIAVSRGDFPSSLTIGPFARARGNVSLPGSKSISNRTLLLSALGAGTTTLGNLLDADDTARMLEALALLGVRVERDPATRTCVVHGTAGPANPANAGLGRPDGQRLTVTSSLATQSDAAQTLVRSVRDIPGPDPMRRRKRRAGSRISS